MDKVAHIKCITMIKLINHTLVKNNGVRMNENQYTFIDEVMYMYKHITEKIQRN